MAGNSDAFEVEGYWWLPQTSESRVPGVLRYSRSAGGELSLIGQLRDPLTEGGGGEPGTSAGLYPLIHGLEGTQAFTLEDAFRTSARSPLGGAFGTERIRVNRILRGAWFEEAEVPGAISVSFSFDHLNDWILENGLVEELTFAEPGSNGVTDPPTITVVATGAPDRIVSVDDSYTLVLHHGVGVDGDRINRRTLTQGCSWTIKAKHGVTALQGFLDQVAQIEGLLCVALDTSCGLEFISLQHPEVYRDLSSRRILTPIDLFVQWGTTTEKADQVVHPHDQLFTFSQLGGPDGVGRWMDVAGQHSMALARIIAARFRSPMFVSDRLLNATAAVEGFDRTTSGVSNTKLKPALRRCATLAGEPFAALVGDLEIWAERVRVERNEVAHSLGMQASTSGTELLVLSRSLYLLFVLCMLRQCRAESEAFDQVRRSRQFEWIQPRLQVLLAGGP